MPTVSEITELSDDDCRWLTTETVAEQIRIVQQSIRDGDELISILKRVRKELTATRSQILLQQATLRSVAEKKFRLADRMFFTEKGLQQASGDQLADYKSKILSGFRAICDLCTGIGGDAMSIAGAGSECVVTGVELSRTTAFFANENLKLVSSGHSIKTADASLFSVTEFDAWHLDPDQRSAGRRSRDVNQLSPGLEVIERFLRGNRNGCVKLSPSAVMPPRWLENQEQLKVEYVGDRRECKQQLLWFGDLAGDERQAATILSAGAEPSTFSVTEAEMDLRAESLGDDPRQGMFLFEPHATVVAAGLVDCLASKLDLQRIEPEIDYLIGTTGESHAALSGFEIVDVSTADKKQVRKMLTRHSARLTEFKKRGVDHKLMDSFRNLKAAGTTAHTLVVTRTIHGRRAILCRRQAEAV